MLKKDGVTVIMIVQLDIHVLEMTMDIMDMEDA